MSPSPSNPESSSPSNSKETSVPNMKTPTPPAPDEQRTAAGDAAAAYAGPQTVAALCAAYLWPGKLAGGAVAIVELGGGWVRSDMDSIYQFMDQPSPHFANDCPYAAQNNLDQSAGSQDDPSYEIALHIEIAGATYLRGEEQRDHD